jgi:pimeloyl-ACP methyl ester carboxylesterase
VQRPDTRYAKSGEFHIAYQIVGSGPPDLIYVPGWLSHLDLYWEQPLIERFLLRLGSFSRLIVFDKRGIGLSDPVPDASTPTLEERMDDVRAVLDDAGSERAAVLGQGYGTPIATLFAATYPSRTSALVLYSPSPRAGARTPDYPWGPTEAELEAWTEDSTAWGTREFAQTWVERLAPSAAGDPRFVEWAARMMRAAASPRTSSAFSRMNALMDVREILPLIRVPTLVLGRSDALLPKGPFDSPPLEEDRYVAERIPGARLAELPGRDYLPFVGDQDSLVDEIALFVTGVAPAHEPDRVLVTVLFTDIVSSTARASELGDRAWKELLGRHNVVVREHLARFGGVEIERVGDGFLATFDGPARGVRCARAIVEALKPEGIDVRAGLHAGEVELLEDGISGIAVHVGARVAALAGSGEVLATSTIKDLVAGSGIEFADRGPHELKGVAEPTRLFVALG